MSAFAVSDLLEWLIAATIVAGGGFTLIGSIGLLRLDDIFQRMHAPTKATTLGVGLILLASSASAWLFQGVVSLHEMLVAALLFVSAPVSAHLVARVALHQGLGDRTGLDDPAPSAETSQPGKRSAAEGGAPAAINAADAPRSSF